MSDLLPRRRWSQRAHEGLVALLDPSFPGPRIAALDWDETAMRGDISYALLDDLQDQAGEDLWSDYRTLIASDRMVAYTTLARQLQRGRTPAQVRQWTREVVARRVADGSMAWIEEIADLVGALHKAGWQVWVVSGSPTPVVATLAPRYGIPPERVLGMTAPLGADGAYLDQLQEPVTWRRGKVDCLERAAGALPGLALGDSEGDIQLLQAAAHAVWLDRGDPELAAAAQRAGWWRQEAWT